MIKFRKCNHWSHFKSHLLHFWNIFLIVFTWNSDQIEIQMKRLILSYKNTFEFRTQISAVISISIFSSNENWLDYFLTGGLMVVFVHLLIWRKINGLKFQKKYLWKSKSSNVCENFAEIWNLFWNLEFCRSHEAESQ